MLKPEIGSIYKYYRRYVIDSSEAVNLDPAKFLAENVTSTEILVYKVLDNPTVLLFENVAGVEVVAICGYAPNWQEMADMMTYTALIPFHYYETPAGFIEIRLRSFPCSPADENLLEEMIKEGVTFHYERLRTGEWSLTAETFVDDVVFIQLQRDLCTKRFLREFLHKERMAKPYEDCQEVDDTSTDW